ncbi:MAG: PilZ domain-containing protein [Nitrospirae bacterium]|nr:PilZ domain-containing protein [Nitrospirota bacterium]
MEINDIPILERRKSPRLEDNIFVFNESGFSSTGKFKAVTKNISAGGLMFETEGKIPVEKELKFEIYQPTKSSKDVIFSLPVLAKVIWTKRTEKDNFEQGENRYMIGAKFIEIKEEDRQRIAKYVDDNYVKR